MENGYLGMYMKAETTGKAFDFWWNMWETHTEESGQKWRTLSAENYNYGTSYGVTADGFNVWNRWAFVKVKLSDLYSNKNADLTNVYESAVTLINPGVETTVYIQGLGIYTPKVVVDVIGYDDNNKNFPANVTWAPVDGATKYEITNKASETEPNATITIGAAGLWTVSSNVLGADGNALPDEARTVYVHAADENLREVVSFYENEDTGRGTNVGFDIDKKNGELQVTPLGGYIALIDGSVSKALLPAVGDDNKFNAPIYDLSNYWEDGYLGFYIKVGNAVHNDTNNTDLKITLTSQLGEWHKAVYTCSGTSLKDGDNAYKFVKIPLKDFVQQTEGCSGYITGLQQIIFEQDPTNYGGDIWYGTRKIQGLGIYVPVTEGVKVSDITVKNVNGATPSYTAGEELTVSAKVTNATNFGENATLLAACYDGNNLVDFKILKNNEYFEQRGYKKPMSGNYTIPSTVTNPTVKFMIWNSADSMKPYVASFGSAEATE